MLLDIISTPMTQGFINQQRYVKLCIRGSVKYTSKFRLITNNPASFKQIAVNLNVKDFFRFKFSHVAALYT